VEFTGIKKITSMIRNTTTNISNRISSSNKKVGTSRTTIKEENSNKIIITKEKTRKEEVLEEVHIIMKIRSLQRKIKILYHSIRITK
jgi:hypothetical protein